MATALAGSAREVLCEFAKELEADGHAFSFVT